MPVSLPNSTTADNYPAAGAGGAQVAGNDIFTQGWFTVANAAAFAQYEYGIQGSVKNSPDIYLAPGTYPISASKDQALMGIRFRSAVLGTPAQVFGALFYPNDIVLASSSEFSAIVSPSGGIIPGPSGSMQIIQDQTLTVPAAAITFSSIPSSFNHLYLLWSVRSDQVSATSSFRITLNGDAGADYDLSFIRGNGAAVSYGAFFAQNSGYLGEVAGSTATLNTFGIGEFILPNYTNPSLNKSLTGKSHTKDATAAADMWQHEFGVDWRTSAIIASISLFATAGNLIAGSRATLYGL